MRTMYKYELPINQLGECISIQMPKLAVIRHVAFQGDKIFVWAEIDIAISEDSTRHFYVYGTGVLHNGCNPIFIGTLLVGNHLVIHVYEEIKTAEI